MSEAAQKPAVDETLTIERAPPRRFKVDKEAGIAYDMNDQAAKSADQDTDSDVLEEFLQGTDTQNSDEPEGTGESLEVEQTAEPSDDGQEAVDDVEGESPEAEQADDDTLGDEDEQQTIAEAAEALGVEPEQLYALVVPDGTDEPKTVGELKDEVRELRQQVATGSSETAAELDKRRLELDQFTEQRLAAIGQVEADYLDQAGLLRQAERALEALKGEEGHKLAAEDPSKYSLAMVKATTQKAEAEQKLAHYQQNQQSILSRRMGEEAFKTAKVMPGWLTPQGHINTAKVQADHAEWLVELGPEYEVGIEEVAQVIDSRFVRMMRDLADFHRKAKAATPERAKTIKRPAIAKRVQKLNVERQKSNTVANEKSRAERTAQARQLPRHDPRFDDSLLNAWD